VRPLLRTSQSQSQAGHARTGAARAASRAQAIAEELRAPHRPLYTLPDRAAEPARPFDFSRAERDGSLVRAEVSLARRIRAHLQRGSLAVALTDNRHTMISVRRDHRGPRYRVRLHHMFADADPIVTRALARYIGSNDPAASRVLGAFIDSQQHRVRPLTRALHTPSLESRGRHFDLQEIYDDLNDRYFAGTISARITWGQRCGKPRRRNSIKMGSYSVEERLIRVHRSLDRAFVPRYFVAWIVYHEMLHQVHQATLVNGRRQFHTPAFLADEARFEHYDRARAWERAHLDEILTY
jgi:hypothetical protein